MSIINFIYEQKINIVSQVGLNLYFYKKINLILK